MPARGLAPAGRYPLPGSKYPHWTKSFSSPKERDVNFYLEIKSGGAWGVEHAVVATLRDPNAFARVVILSFDPPRLIPCTGSTRR